MDLNWTTLISSAITAAVNGVAVVLAVRYTTKLADHVEKKKNGKINGNGNNNENEETN